MEVGENSTARPGEDYWQDIMLELAQGHELTEAHARPIGRAVEPMDEHKGWHLLRHTARDLLQHLACRIEWAMLERLRKVRHEAASHGALNPQDTEAQPEPRPYSPRDLGDALGPARAIENAQAMGDCPHLQSLGLEGGHWLTLDPLTRELFSIVCVVAPGSIPMRPATRIQPAVVVATIPPPQTTMRPEAEPPFQGLGRPHPVEDQHTPLRPAHAQKTWAKLREPQPEE
mmetsp:Transcript_61370/g.176636  ORF Transcript_61370/g.176636 Transcript_61370/m.176636 type:complete len:230 (-) Transcript_61370:634-1323(-)